MANKKISELPAAGALAGTELVEVVKGGVNSQTTAQDIADLGGGGGGTWGSITGTLSSQTDLNTALNGKEDIATQAAVTLANGVTELDMEAGDVQFLTITEAKVIDSIANPFIGTVGFVIPGTFSVTFTTINASITGQYVAGEQNIIWVTCIDATGTPEYTIVYDNSYDPDAVVSSTGTHIQFDSHRFYGEGTPETGAFTLNTTDFKKGRTAVVIHNDSTNPFLTSDGEFIVIGGEYIVDEPNIIYMHAFSTSEIHVTISQYPA